MSNYYPCPVCGRYVWPENQERECPHKDLPEYLERLRREVEEDDQMTQTWPRLSVRLYNAYIDCRTVYRKEHNAFLPFAAFMRLEDRELLQLRNFGKKTLRELRQLWSTHFPEWDEWATALPSAWKQQRLAQEVATAAARGEAA